MAYNNIASVTVNPTTDYFNNFFKPTFDVSSGVDDAVTSFFEKVTGNKLSAKVLANSVISTSKAQNMDPMTVLQEFASLPRGQVNDYLTLFLNLNRVGTSLLGLSNAPTTTKYLTRTILP